MSVTNQMIPIFTHRLEVRFRDCDPMGHVNNAVYLTYLEQARFAHWRALRRGALEAAPAAATGVILAHAEVDYRRPARYGDELEVRIGLARVGRTSFTYDYEIVSAAGELVASARTVQVMYDYTTASPVSVPEEIRTCLPVPVEANPPMAPRTAER